MAVAVVIQSVTLKPDGYVYFNGTVAGVAATGQAIQLVQLLGMTVAQVQQYLALLLAEATGTTVQLASLQTTVNL